MLDFQIAKLHLKIQKNEIVDQKIIPYFLVERFCYNLLFIGQK